MLEMIMSAFNIGSVGELLYDVFMILAILSLPFLLGILYGEIMAKREKLQERIDKRAEERELRRQRNAYIRDMFRQIEELE